jgi:hypothetical protein
LEGEDILIVLLKSGLITNGLIETLVILILGIQGVRENSLNGVASTTRHGSLKFTSGKASNGHRLTVFGAALILDILTVIRLAQTIPSTSVLGILKRLEENVLADTGATEIASGIAGTSLITVRVALLKVTHGSRLSSLGGEIVHIGVLREFAGNVLKVGLDIHKRSLLDNTHTGAEITGLHRTALGTIVKLAGVKLIQKSSGGFLQILVIGVFIIT